MMIRVKYERQSVDLIIVGRSCYTGVHVRLSVSPVLRYVVYLLKSTVDDVNAR